MKIFSYEILQNLIREEFLVEFDLKLEKSSFHALSKLTWNFEIKDFMEKIRLWPKFDRKSKVSCRDIS